MVKPKSHRKQERRKHPRLEHPLYITYKKNGEKFEKELLKSSTPFHLEAKGEKTSVSRNVSVAGICFVTKEKFSSGTKLLVKIWSPPRPKPLIGLAEVMWQTKRIPAPGYLTGVAFASLEDREELSRLLEIFKELNVEKMTGKIELP